MKAEEHPLSQSLGFCENCGCANAERELQDSLLKAEQERDEARATVHNISKVSLKRISELEETISAQKKEIEEERSGRWREREKKEAVLKGLREIAEWKLPPTGEFYYEDGKVTERPISFEAAYGSNGVRYYFKKLAADLLAETL